MITLKFTIQLICYFLSVLPQIFSLSDYSLSQGSMTQQLSQQQSDPSKIVDPDIIELQKCFHLECEEQQQTVYKSMTLTMAYMPFLSCLNEKTSCQTSQTLSHEIIGIAECYETCSNNNSEYPPAIIALNKCTTSCANRASAKYRIKNDSLSSDPKNRTFTLEETILIVAMALVIFSIVICAILKLTNNKPNRKLHEINSPSTQFIQPDFIEFA